MNTEVLYSNHPAMFRDNPLLFTLLLLLTPLIIGAVGLLAWYLGVRSNQLTVTRTGMLHEQGLLSKRRTELGLSNVRSVEVFQTLFNRMMNTGKVTVYTTGDEPHIVVKGLPDPNRIKAIVREAREAG